MGGGRGVISNVSLHLNEKLGAVSILSLSFHKNGNKMNAHTHPNLHKYKWKDTTFI